MPALRHTRARKPRKQEVMRSFRIPPAVDRALGAAARQTRRSKSGMMREILISWLQYHRHLPATLETTNDEG